MAWLTDGLYQFGAGMAWWEWAELSWYKIALRKCLVRAVVLGTEDTWDLGEKPSPKHTQSQKLPAEGKPPQIPTTRYLSHLARDPCETVLILTDPWPNSEDNHLPPGPGAFPWPALLGQTITKLVPLQGRSRQGCGTHRHQPQWLFCIWILFVSVGHNDYNHCSTSPVLPCCQSILHPREYPSYGLGEGGGCCCSSAALLCFVLRVQLPET